MHITPRFRYALKACISHLLASALVAGLAAVLVFVFWYPFPYDQITGGRHLFWLLISVDMGCGPLLTLVVFSPTKTRVELTRDLTLIVIVQLAALGYGMHVLAQARPLAMVFDTDRFRVVSLADLDPDEPLSESALTLQERFGPWSHWSLAQPTVMGVRKSIDSAELMQSVERSLAGTEPSQRPSWWRDYALSVPQVLQRAKPLAELSAKHAAQKGLLDAAVTVAIANAKANETNDPAALLWLPIVSRRVTDWVVLLDPVTARIRGSAHLDGF